MKLGELNQLIQTCVSSAVAAVTKVSNVSNQNDGSSSFTFPEWKPRDVLHKREQWQMWKSRVLLDLQALGLESCLENEAGNPKWSEDRRSRMVARTQTYLNAATSYGIRARGDKPKPMNGLAAAAADFERLIKSIDKQQLIRQSADQ